jgi:cobalt-zinc-cadmium efflux system membrane fusion protein
MDQELPARGPAEAPSGPPVADASPSGAFLLSNARALEGPTPGAPTADGPNPDGPNPDGPNPDGPRSDASPPEAPAGLGRYGRRALSVGIVALLVLAVIDRIAGPVGRYVLGPSQPLSMTGELRPPARGAAFAPTANQWATLKIRPVIYHLFQPAAEADGKIILDEVTPVFSPYSGRVTRLIAHDGDIVRQGDPLFAVQAMELVQAQNDLITAVSGLRTARAQLNLAQTNEQRQHALYQVRGAALRDWQQAQVDLATAQGGLNGASIALAAVRNRLRILGRSDAETAATEATADPLTVNGDTVVRAPIGGTVVQRELGLGQNIASTSAGATSPVFTIGDMSELWMVGYAREADAPDLHPGQQMEVHVPAYPGRVFSGRLNYVAASLDAANHRLTLRARVQNPDGALKPEMMAQLRILTGPAVSAPAVPARAVVYEGALARVWVADPAAKTLELRLIKPGLARDGMVEVLAGLKVGESVVSAGSVFIDRGVAAD